MSKATTSSGDQPQAKMAECSDGVNLPINDAFIKQCGTIRAALSMAEGSTLPLKTMHSKVLKTICQFCDLHASDPEYVSCRGPIPIRDEDIHFFKDIDNFTDIIKAANYLDNDRLIDTILCEINRRIEGKSTEEICRALNIPRS